MKKQYLLGMMLLASVSFLTSCSDNENVSEPVQGKAAVVEISVIGNASRASSGKENSLTAESAINGYEAYTFDATGAAIDYKLISGNGTSTLMAEVGNNTIVVIANSAIGEVADYDVLKTTVGTFAFNYTNSGAVPTGGFEMYGEETKNIIDGNNNATVIVKRLVSKFANPDFSTVTVNIPAADLSTLFGEGATITGTSFEYTARALANGLDKSYVYPIVSNTAWNVADWASTGLTYLNSSFDVDGNYENEKVYSGSFLLAADNDPIYVHENYPALKTVAGIKGYDPSEVYCFIIAGELTHTDGVDSKTETRYWRINLLKSTGSGTSLSNDDYCVRRNGVYYVTVNTINTIGWGTPEEAEKETPVIPAVGESTVTISVKVDDWDVYTSETEM